MTTEGIILLIALSIIVVGVSLWVIWYITKLWIARR